MALFAFPGLSGRPPGLAATTTLFFILVLGVFSVAMMMVMITVAMVMAVTAGATMALVTAFPFPGRTARFNFGLGRHGRLKLGAATPAFSTNRFLFLHNTSLLLSTPAFFGQTMFLDKTPLFGKSTLFGETTLFSQTTLLSQATLFCFLQALCPALSATGFLLGLAAFLLFLFKSPAPFSTGFFLSAVSFFRGTLGSGPLHGFLLCSTGTTGGAACFPLCICFIHRPAQVVIRGAIRSGTSTRL